MRPNFSEANEIMVEVICGDRTVAVFDLAMFDIIEHNGEVNFGDGRSSLTVPASAEWFNYGDELEEVWEVKLNGGSLVRVSWSK